MEILAVLLLGISVYLLIVIIFQPVGERLDTVKRRLEFIGNAKKTIVLNEEMTKPLSERFIKPLLKSMAEKISISDKNGDANSFRIRQANKLKKMLSQAGLELSAAEYGVVRMLVIFGLAGLFGLLALAMHATLINVFLLAFIGLFIGYVGLRFFLASTITKRKMSMERQIPDMLDLLSVSVEAGLGFEQALYHIINHMEGPLIDELTVTYREMTMGRPRKEALTLFGERCDIEELKSFVGALIQATQLGISIKNVLRTQATAMRQSRKAKVQENAQKISIKMLIPMVLFIFPVIFIIILGPAIVNVLAVLKK